MSIVTLPQDIFSKDGTVYDIQTDGRINDGLNNAFDGGMDWTDFRGFFGQQAELTLDGRALEITSNVNSNTNLTATRSIYVSPDGYARYLDTLENTTNTALTYTFDFTTDLGSNSDTASLATSSGDAAFAQGDVSIVTDDSADGASGFDDAVGLVFGEAGGLAPSIVAAGNDIVRYQYTVQLAPGESASVLHFATHATDAADVQDTMALIETFDASVLYGLTENDLDDIVNFDTTDWDLPNDLYVGSSDDDQLIGGGLDERFVARDGDDLVLTGSGDDRVEAGDGDDLIIASGGENDIEAGDGDDNVTSTGLGDDLIKGGSGDDLLSVTAGDNTVKGGAGDDTLFGGAGNDLLDGDDDLTQSDADVVTIPSTGQDLAVTLTVPDESNASDIEVSGFINRAPVTDSEFNIVYVVDRSGSTDDTFQGTETVGDLNGDGNANELIDGIIAGFQSLNGSLIDAGLATTDVSIVQFDGGATTIYSGQAGGGVNSSLATINAGGSTNFESALQETIDELNRMGGGENRVFFLSDGENNSGASTFADEVSTLLDSNGLDAEIRAIGLGASADLAQLDLLDDGIANNSAERVLTPSELNAGLAGSPVQGSEIDELRIFVNGTLTRTLEPSQFQVTPFGLRYDTTLSGLSLSADDEVRVDLVASDPASTTACVALTIPEGGAEAGDDLILAGGGDDFVFGDAGDDTLHGGDGNDALRGESGRDLLLGDAGNDDLIAGSGNDTLIGGVGADLLDGGSGIDEIGFGNSFGGVQVNLTTGRGEGGEADGDTYTSIERVVGSTFNDLITGSSNDDTLFGGRGNDSLRGSAGNDVLEGGIGSDDLNGGSGIDAAAFTTAGSAVTVNLTSGIGSAGNANGDTYTSIEDVIGSDFSDLITGSSGDNFLEGERGNDTLRGSAGNDTIEGGVGQDEINGGSGTDAISFFTAGSAVTANLTSGVGTQGNANGDTYVSIENMFGSDHADLLTGSSDNNVIEGGRGHDTLRGSAGNDRIEGGIGRDEINGGSGSDAAAFATAGAGVALNLTTGVGTAGNANGDTYVSIEHVIGSDHDDFITGSSGRNILIGGRGEDVLRGSAGNDVLRGGLGDDTLNGGSGADEFRFDTGLGSGSNVDVIENYSIANDFISLDDRVFDAMGSTLSASEFRIGSSAQDANDYIIYNSATGALFYDADGAGGASQIQFAELRSGLSMTASEFDII